MAKGFGGMPPGGMNNLMKQAQKMQKQMAQMQEELKSKTIESSSGGGAVKVVINGEHMIESLTIDETVLDDVEMLQDLVMTAINEGMRQMDEMVNNQMSKLTGGMGLPPGLF
ncbi:MAG: YbaB/EbfC family nucleoid-associated protein [Defluviitaleaceae bacterium]|nr:YbaB/EbfC family nucleoid-associated protein [Defluviitaleaceae bacterium]